MESDLSLDYPRLCLHYINILQGLCLFFYKHGWKWLKKASRNELVPSLSSAHAKKIAYLLSASEANCLQNVSFLHRRVHFYAIKLFFCISFSVMNMMHGALCALVCINIPPLQLIDSDNRPLSCVQRLTQLCKACSPCFFFCFFFN